MEYEKFSDYMRRYERETAQERAPLRERSRTGMGAVAFWLAVILVLVLVLWVLTSDIFKAPPGFWESMRSPIVIPASSAGARAVRDEPRVVTNTVTRTVYVPYYVPVPVPEERHMVGGVGCYGRP